jgi:hypothetical protein
MTESVSTAYPRAPGSLANVMAEFDAAAAYLSLSPQEVALLKEPRLSLRLKLPVRMDNGSIHVFKAYHTVHSTTRENVHPCLWRTLTTLRK